MTTLSLIYLSLLLSNFLFLLLIILLPYTLVGQRSVGTLTAFVFVA